MVTIKFVRMPQKPEYIVKGHAPQGKYSNNNTLFVFDDIHWSQGMENAWKSIKEHPKTTVTIDLFFIGIVFIKKELSKENFTIRF